ncbi:endonuclease [Solicola gregarius]|uniref:Endonuclease n=1 Tax=Solicola gregarius TaxID=2908642 RepID=A0AA46YKH3_9ACTN|nr:endonuclease [Solicola gregarius]UYM04466.1 endonuclease [Solicola gregarius]
MMPERADRIARIVIDRYGTTFAAESGITLRDKPSPLWRLLVLTVLLSARIDATLAVRSARELSRAGWRTPQRMLETTWQERVDALGRGGYRRYDERTSTRLAELATDVRDEWGSDLRRLHDHGGDDAERLANLLQRFKGVGPTGATIFLREVQAVWPGLVPYADPIAADGAERLGLPRDPVALRGVANDDEFGRLVAGCVRAARSDAIVDDVTAAAHGVARRSGRAG